MISEPESGALEEEVLGPPAASERMSGLVAVQGAALPLSAGLMALEVDQVEFEAARPRQTRQVAARRLVVSAGSRSVGASRSVAS